MSDLIERSEVLRQLRLNHKDVVYIDKNECARRIEAIPSAEVPTTMTGIIDAIREAEYRGYMKAVEDRPKGEWKPFDLTWGRSLYACSVCEEVEYLPCDAFNGKPLFKYCPNCGAKMKGADDDNA